MGSGFRRKGLMKRTLERPKCVPPLERRDEYFLKNPQPPVFGAIIPPILIRKPNRNERRPPQ